MSTKQFTFTDFKNIPVEVVVWNSSSEEEKNPDRPELCIDYHHVADTHDLMSLRARSKFLSSSFAIVSLLYSEGDNFFDLESFAHVTGHLTVAIIVKFPGELRRDQRFAVKGLKHRIIQKLGWSSVKCALDDKPLLWSPFEKSVILEFDNPPRIPVYQIEWSQSFSETTPEDKFSGSNVPSLSLLVRKDLHLTSGKLATQCIHATVGACCKTLDQLPTRSFIQAPHDRRNVIILRVTDETEMRVFEERAKNAELNIFIQFDVSNKATILAIGPDEPGKIKSVTNELKLY